MSKDTNFVKGYFTNKPKEGLMSAITPNWDDKNTKYHLGLINCPTDAKNIIEIGSGIGRLIKSLDRDDRNFICIEASEDMIELGKKYLEDIKASVLWVKSENGIKIDSSYNGFADFVYSIITFQHIPNLNAVLNYLSDAYILLREGGILTFQVLRKEFNRGDLWTYHSLDYLHIHLRKLGFKNIELKKVGDSWAVFRCNK
jgi:SAM-dependent methyltransferase